MVGWNGSDTQGVFCGMFPFQDGGIDTDKGGAKLRYREKCRNIEKFWTARPTVRNQIQTQNSAYSVLCSRYKYSEFWVPPLDWSVLLWDGVGPVHSKPYTWATILTWSMLWNTLEENHTLMLVKQEVGGGQRLFLPCVKNIHIQTQIVWLPIETFIYGYH